MLVRVSWLSDSSAERYRVCGKLKGVGDKHSSTQGIYTHSNSHTHTHEIVVLSLSVYIIFLSQNIIIKIGF